MGYYKRKRTSYVRRQQKVLAAVDRARELIIGELARQIQLGADVFTRRPDDGNAFLVEREADGFFVLTYRTLENDPKKQPRNGSTIAHGPSVTVAKKLYENNAFWPPKTP